MENYIAYFTTVSEYEQKSGNLPKPNVAYVEENRQLYYNKASHSQPSRIWVDDFDGPISSYDDYDITDPEGMGANPYNPINETINIDGINYCLWEADDLLAIGGQPQYLLTTTYDYDTLYNQSLEVDDENEFTAYYSMMIEDDELYHTEDSTQKLLKIEKL